MGDMQFVLQSLGIDGGRFWLILCSRTDEKINWHSHLTTKHHGIWCLPRRRMLGRPVGHRQQSQMLVPVSLRLADPKAEHVFDGSIKSFDHAIRTWVVGRRPRFRHPQERTHFPKDCRLKVSALIRVQLKWDAKSCHKFLYELSCHSGSLGVRDGVALRPSGEVIADHHDEFVSPVRNGKGPQNVHSNSLKGSPHLVVHHLCWLGPRRLFPFLAHLAVLDPTARSLTH